MTPLAAIQLAQTTALRGGKWSLESLLCSPHGFGLTTASPLQRAICRIADGRPLAELQQHPEVVAALGTSESDVRIPPHELVLLSGIRGGKSLFCGAAAVRSALTCDVSGLRASDFPVRVPVVSTTRKIANTTFEHIYTSVRQSPVLRQCLLTPEPVDNTIQLRHPSGYPVEITVSAGSKAGSSLVSKWLAGVIFDEAPRLQSSEDGVINLDHQRAAVMGRMLPGAQIMYPGSPWRPEGTVYNLYREFWGKPSEKCVVIKAPGWAMNPIYWTPERCAKLKEEHPDVWLTDCAAEFGDGDENLFPGVLLERAELSSALHPRMRGVEYGAAIDPSGGGNAWTLCIAGGFGGGMVKVVRTKLWQGSKLEPLKPDAVLAECARICAEYGVETVDTDEWAYSALRDIAERHGLSLRQVPSARQANRYLAVKTRMADGKVQYVSGDPRVRQHLLGVVRRKTPNGYTIILPSTSDGMHCDYAPSFVRAVDRFLSDPVEVEERRTPEQIVEDADDEEHERSMREEEDDL